MKINDPVFGEMEYAHRWYKRQVCSMFGADWDITVAAKAYSGKEITESQRKSYARFCREERRLIDAAADALKRYLDSDMQDSEAVYRADINRELSEILRPKTLLFKQDGTAVLLLDCAWDEEHGIAVKLLPEIVVGSQDLFL